MRRWNQSTRAMQELSKGMPSCCKAKCGQRLPPGLTHVSMCHCHSAEVCHNAPGLIHKLQPGGLCGIRARQCHRFESTCRQAGDETELMLPGPALAPTRLL